MCGEVNFLRSALSLLTALCWALASGPELALHTQAAGSLLSPGTGLAADRPQLCSPSPKYSEWCELRDWIPALSRYFLKINTLTMMGRKMDIWVPCPVEVLKPSPKLTNMYQKHSTQSNIIK